MTGWIGVDLDGTLAHYDGWIAVNHIGGPVPLMMQRVRDWLAQGIEVRIFTARVSYDTVTNRQARAAIDAWCELHGLPFLLVTNVKDSDMRELWDDRAVQVVKNTGEIVGPPQRSGGK